MLPKAAFSTGKLNVKRQWLRQRERGRKRTREREKVSEKGEKERLRFASVAI